MAHFIIIYVYEFFCITTIVVEWCQFIIGHNKLNKIIKYYSRAHHN